MRILILSASIGMGHVRAAQAVEHAFMSIGRGMEVRHEDALDFANPAFRKIAQKSYSELVANAPDILGFAYNYSDKAWEKLHFAMDLERQNIRKLVGLVKEYKPDAVVCTHPLPADMISWLLSKNLISCQHAIVVTDFDLHPVWLCRYYSRYFVALDETKEHMVALGFDRERVSVSGIPIDPVFGHHKDKQESRSKFNLDPNRMTILISAGGFGMGPIESILAETMKLNGSNQIIALCGLNIELYERLTSFARKNSRAGDNVVKVLGYTSEMDEYMSASDLIVGKPGGLTASEALAKGVVFVIVNPIPGQEERNADHLIEEGTAIRCNNLPALSYKIWRLLSNPRRLETMQRNALALARPQAAITVAREVLQLVERGEGCAIHPLVHTRDSARLPQLG